jgi:hypothetical protein
LEVRNFEGRLIAKIKAEHAGLVRGAGLFGNYFFSYADDRKLNFYEQKDFVDFEGKIEVDEEKQSDVEKEGMDMIVDDEDIQQQMRAFGTNERKNFFDMG